MPTTRRANRPVHRHPHTPPKPAPPKPTRTRRAVARDLDLTAVRCTCGHLARDYGLRAGDWIWCNPCADQRRVSEVIAS